MLGITPIKYTSSVTSPNCAKIYISGTLITRELKNIIEKNKGTPKGSISDILNEKGNIKNTMCSVILVCENKNEYMWY